MKSINIQDFITILQTNKGLDEYEAFHKPSWNVRLKKVSLPSACLYQSRLNNNIHWIARFAKQSPVLKGKNLAAQVVSIVNTQDFANVKNVGV